MAERHPHRMRRILARVGISLLAVAVLATGGVYTLYRHYLGNVKHEDVFSQVRPQSPTVAEGAGKALNILLIGSDDRTQGDNAQYQAGAGLEQQTQHESDTIIVAHIAADAKHGVFVSIPRDSMVDMPSCPLPNGKTSTAKLRMINEAFNMGGATCSVKTVEALTNIRIDHYVEVDFSGFKRMTEALDGIPVNICKNLNDPVTGLKLAAGEQRVKGEQALQLVRARHNIGGGSDLERITRQQQFLSAVVRQATDTGLLLRPDKLLPFLEAATKSVTVDTDLAKGDNMLNLAKRLKSLKPENVAFVTIPNKPYPADINRVVWTDAATGVWEALRNDTPLPGGAPTPGATTPPLIVDASKITVEVLNGTSTQGLARTTGDALTTAGFNVVSVATAPEPSATTIVRYGPNKADSARTLAAVGPAGTQLVLDPSLGSTLTLTLGSDWTGVKPLPSAPPAPIKSVSAGDNGCI